MRARSEAGRGRGSRAGPRCLLRHPLRLVYPVPVAFDSAHKKREVTVALGIAQAWHPTRQWQCRPLAQRREHAVDRPAGSILASVARTVFKALRGAPIAVTLVLAVGGDDRITGPFPRSCPFISGTHGKTSAPVLAWLAIVGRGEAERSLLSSGSAVARMTIAGVASVIDGDTIEIHGQRIRLHGIDAPEGGQTCLDAAGRTWRCGQRAALALQDLIGRRTVTCDERDVDRYGRIVGRCLVGDLDINEWLVVSGPGARLPQVLARLRSRGGRGSGGRPRHVGRLVRAAVGVATPSSDPDVHIRAQDRSHAAPPGQRRQFSLMPSDPVA